MVKFPEKYFQIISILNSLYLSFLYLEGFLFERNTKQLADVLIVTIFTAPFILLILLHLKIVRKRFRFFSDKRNFLLFIFLVIIANIFGVFLFDALRGNKIEIIFKTISIIFEVVCISFALKQDKQQRILKLIGYFSLCFFTGVATYSLLGIFEKYIAHNKFENTIAILFFATFFHFFNACFLFYKFLPNKYRIL